MQGEDMRAAAWWLDSTNGECGARRPDLQERGRVMGAPEHWAALGQDLTARQLHDAQGNAFDPRALTRRIGPGIEAWIHGQDPPRHRFPGVDTAWHVFHHLAKDLASEGFQPSAFPGLHPTDFAANGPRPTMDTDDATSGNTPPAAEHGRRGR